MMRRTNHIFPKLLLAALLLFIAAPFVAAQVPVAPGISSSSTSSTTPSTSAQNEASDDPLDRGTPHGTVLGFLKAANAGDYDTAAQFLDTRQRGELAAKLAEQLQDVLNHETSIDLTKISRSPQGSQLITGNPNREQIGVIANGNEKLSLYLDRVKRDDEPPIWLFSQETLHQIPDAYDNISAPSPLEQKMPAWLQAEFWAMPVWRWLTMLILLPVILLLGAWVNHLMQPVLQRFGQDTKVLRAPLRLFFVGILLLYFGTTAESLLGRARWHNYASIVTVIAVTWLATRTVGLVSELAVSRLKRLQSSDQIAIAGLIGRLAQIAAIAIGLLVILGLRGINLTAALTGLGIGGLAVAFAAQKTLENLFGGIMIISDRPLRIGDQCKIGTVEGYVLDIGLRSTRIRTFNRTIVVIPNGQLSTMNVENYTFRDKFWFHHIINLKYDSTSEQIERVLDGIRKLLTDDPLVETETSRARFIAIGSVSDDIEISAYVLAASYPEFLARQEELLLKILAIVETAGAEFSLPTQVTKVEGTGSAGTTSPLASPAKPA